MTLVKPPSYAYYPKGEPVPTVEEASHPLFDFSDHTHIRRLAKAIALQNDPYIAGILNGELAYAYRDNTYNVSALAGFIFNFKEYDLKLVQDVLYPLIEESNSYNAVANDAWSAIDLVLSYLNLSDAQPIPLRTLLNKQRSYPVEYIFTAKETDHPFLRFSDSEGALFGNIMSLARSIAAHNTPYKAGLLSGELSNIYRSGDFDRKAIAELFSGLEENDMAAVLRVLLPLDKASNKVATTLVMGLAQAVKDTQWSDEQPIPLDVLI